MTAAPNLPSTSAMPAVPADATGTYPNLAGYAPIELGRRVLVGLADAGIFLGFYLVYLAVSMATVLSEPGWFLAFSLVLPAVYVAATLWALFARSARLAGAFLGARYVDVRTGRPAKGALFLKYLLQSALSVVTLGIAPLVMVFATVQQPLQRNWFDRTTGLMLVDTRRGRSPDEPFTPPTPKEPVQAPVIASVSFPGVAAPSVPVPVPHLAPLPATLAPVEGSLSASPYEFGAGSSLDETDQHGRHAPISPVFDPGGIITSVPGSGSHAARPPAAAPPECEQAPRPVVRELHSVDAALADLTILSPDSAIEAEQVRPHAYLDGAQLSLEPPTVIGRNPRAPGSHPDAVPHVVSDLLTSKTHLILGRDETGPWVIDLHSTNGVFVVKVPSGEPARVEVGRKIHLPPGSRLQFGGQTIEIH